MTHVRSCCLFFAAVVGIGGVGCQLRRPSTVSPRMIEPQLIDPQTTEPVKQITRSANSIPIRLLETQARGHIGRRVLHQSQNGELTEDSVWRWSSFPNHYLDTALRQEVEANPNLHLVDSASAPAVAATLLVWDLESSGETRLVGAAEFQIIGTDRTVHSRVVRASESIAGNMPGDLAVVSGRVLQRLAAEGLASIAGER